MGDLQKLKYINDNCRKQLNSLTCPIILENKLLKLGPEYVEKCMETIRQFDRFNENSDLDGDHTYGSLYVRNRQVFFKLRYRSNIESVDVEEPLEILPRSIEIGLM